MQSSLRIPASLGMDVVAKRWRSTTLETSHALVACNVYMSAGRSHHGDLLLKLLSDTQKLCSQLRSDSREEVTLVHAFSDGPYDRSSFHFAGRPHHLATVATKLALSAIDGLLLKPQDHDDEELRHPFVGLVDHVAVMPLVDGQVSHFPETIRSISPSGKAAEYIGNKLKEAGVEVYLYGSAHIDGTSLADVRRERTRFFRSGGLELESSGSACETSRRGVSTVGATQAFVENFNIRLTANCDKNMARSLTRALRERDGGLEGVEGLTLPYSNNRFEIACNLLRPDVGSCEAMMETTHKWAEAQLQSSRFESIHDLVEIGYRVGTTAEQCIHVLSLSTEEIDVHDKEVKARLKGNLGLL